MTSWSALDDELERWRDDGGAPSLWWRDDDATRGGDALDRLIALNRQWNIPLALAVIPGLAEPSLAETLSARPDIAILQHGFRHTNHATSADKKSELGPHRSVVEIIGQLNEGRRLMQSLFGDGALPVLVPPWNRVDPRVVAELPDIGFHGISGFQARAGREIAPGLVQVNTHVDIIDWQQHRGFRGVEAVLGDLCGHLAARRTGAVDASEPTGLLTHHMAHDDACWAFIEALLERTSLGVDLWQSAAGIFALRADLQ